MVGYLLRRLGASALTLLGVVVIGFLILRLAPGDPALIAADTGVSVEQIEKLREQIGLNKPLAVQFALYISRLMRGDLGFSIYTNETVKELIRQRLPFTLSLAFGALLLSILLGVPAGIIAAVRRDSVFDFGVIGLTLVGLCVPIFWLGLVMILIFAVWLKWFPISGGVSVSSGIVAYLQHMTLPWITLALSSLGLLARLVRSGLLEELGSDYVRTARAKGLGETRVVVRHALRNAMNPVITVTGLQLGALIGGAVLTEMVFSLPGMGRLMVRAITFRDYPIVQGILILVAGGFVLVNLLVDLLYGLSDPRVRYQ